MAKKKYYIGKSKIEGNGAFAKQALKPGDYIDKVHTINKLYTDYDFTNLGRNHNHSENPNVQNVLIGNERHLFAIEPIKKGEELTSNYRLQPDLEQPENFEKAKKGKKLTSGKAREILHDKSVHGHPLTDKQRKFFGAVASGAPIKTKTGGWLDKYQEGGVSKEQSSINKSKDFLEKMINSPLFAERYAKMTNRPLRKIDKSEIENYKQSLLNNLNTVNIGAPEDYPGNKSDSFNMSWGEYWRNPYTSGQKPHTLYLRPQVGQSTITHEFSHATTKANELLTNHPTFDYDPSLSKDSQKYEEGETYFQSPTEIKGRRDAIGEFMMDRGLWDPTKEKFGRKHYRKLKSIQKDIEKKFEENKEYDHDAIDPILQFMELSEPRSKKETIRLFNSFVKNDNEQGELDTAKTGGWLDNYSDGGVESRQAGYTNIPFNYNSAWGGQFAMGGSIPGSVGFTYARTNSPAPSNGPYAKKTLASAQGGKKIPNDKSTQEFWKKLDDYYTSDKASEKDKARYKTFKEYNDLHGYAPVRITNRTVMGRRQMTNPFTGEINIIAPNENEKDYQLDLMNQYLEEYPHYQQFNKNPNESNFRKSLRFIGNMGKDFGTMLTNLPNSGFNFKKAYDKVYDTPGTSEYEAHTIMGKQMDDELESMMKKNFPSEQKNGGITYYQHGLDWKPRNISKDGNDVPKNQNAQYVLPRFDMPRVASESTSRTFYDPITRNQKSTATVGQKSRDIKAVMKDMGRGRQKERDEEKQRIAERKAAVATKDKGKPFTLPSGETKKYEDMSTREKMYVSGKALEQRGRLNENEESFFDEWINPLNVIGSMAGGLGTAPYEAKASDSNVPYVSAIANPLIMGFLGFDPLGDVMKVPAVADRYLTNVGRSLAEIEKQGLREGLSSHDIAKRQMEQIGITSNQRKAYVPGVSEFLEKNVVPYGYGGFGKDSKLTQTLKNIFGKDKHLSKYSSEGVLSELRNPAREDAWSLYLGKPQKYNTFRIAETAPINHPSYSPGSLKNMDIYSVNYENELIPKVGQTNPNIGTSTNPHIVEKKIEPLLKQITLDREGNVMGGYNRRLSSSGLQYNDVWNLEPQIKIPFTDKKVTIPIDKFIGKPFMSHGNIPYTWAEHQANLTKFLDSKIADKLAIQKELGIDFTPQVSRLLQQLEKVKSATPIKKKGGVIRNISKDGNDVPKNQNAKYTIPNLEIFKTPITQNYSSNAQLVNKMKADEVQRVMAEKRKAQSERTFIGQGKPTTPESEERRKRLNQQYAATHPYASIDEQGNLSRRFYDRSMETQLGDKNTTAAGIDKGLTHAQNAMDAAGLVMGVGALTSAGYNATKAALAKSMESGFLSKAHTLNPFAGTFAGESKLPSFLQFNKLDDLNAFWRLTKDPKNFGLAEGAYFNKGVPLTGDLANTFPKGSRAWTHRYSGLVYNPETKLMDRYAGPDYLFKVGDESFMKPHLNFPEPHLKFYRQSGNIPEGESQLFRKDWLRGWTKEVPKPKFISSEPVITRGPINYWEEPGFAARNPNFKHESYVNSVNKFGNTSGDIPPDLMPYINTPPKQSGIIGDIKQMFTKPNQYFRKPGTWGYDPIEESISREWWANNRGNIDPFGETGPIPIPKYTPGALDWNKIGRTAAGVGAATGLMSLGLGLKKQKQGGLIEDDRGQWAHPGEITEIGSNQITMQGVPYPVLGVSDEGDTQMMYPEQEYKFKGKKVTEFPINKNGGWLNKYK